MMVVAAIGLLAMGAPGLAGYRLWQLLVLLIVAAAPIGSLFLWDYIAAHDRAQQATHETARSRQSLPLQSSPFRQRLATYLHVPESEVLPPRPRPLSSMPFWSSVPLSPRPIVMKSVEFIRAVLERIHAAVRG